MGFSCWDGMACDGWRGRTITNGRVWVGLRRLRLVIMGNAAYKPVTVEESWGRHAKAFGAEGDAASNGAALLAVFDQSQGNQQGVLVVTQRYLINYNPLSGSRRLRTRMEDTITCACYLASPLFTFKKRPGDEGTSNGLVVVGTSNGQVQVRRAHDYSVVRTIRTRKQLEEQFTRPKAKASGGRATAYKDDPAARRGGYSDRPGGSSGGGRARAPSSPSMHSTKSPRIKISFDDEEDLEELSMSPARVDSRKRGVSDTPPSQFHQTNPGTSAAMHAAAARRTAITPVTAVRTFRSKLGDWVITGDMRGTARIFNLSKGPEFVSCHRQGRPMDVVANASKTKREGSDGDRTVQSTHTASVASIAVWEREFPCLFIGYADGIVGQFNISTGTWIRNIEIPSANQPGPGKDVAKHNHSTNASHAVKMLFVSKEWDLLLGTTFVDKYLLVWDLKHFCSDAIDMTANLPRNSNTFNNSSMATSTFVDPGGKFLFVGFDDGGFTVNSLHFDPDERALTIIPVRIFATIGARLGKGKDMKQLPKWLQEKANAVQWLTSIEYDRFTDTLLTGDVCGVARMVHNTTGQMAVDTAAAAGGRTFETRSGSGSFSSPDLAGVDGESAFDAFVIDDEDMEDEEIEIDLDLDDDF